MTIGIQNIKGSFSDRWIAYCESKGIRYKLVNCYSNDIIEQLSDCEGLMWHFSQNSAKDFLFAKQLIFSLESSGKKVFPNLNTVWHFDDKLGQKYLLESIGAPLVPTWIFYEKDNALKWIEQTVFPKVFKLRSGAGSQNVILIKSRNHAIKIIRKAFGKGIPVFDAFGSLKEEWRKYKLGKTNLFDIVEGLVRLLIPPPYARAKGREKGYAYFQEFIPDNTFDIRIIVIGDKAFGIKRMVRKNDFRASGSGIIFYERQNFSDETVQLSFKMAERLNSQCVAFDFIYEGNRIYVIEVSYGFIKEVYDPCVGYWDKQLNWHEGKFNPYGWMVEELIKK